MRLIVDENNVSFESTASRIEGPICAMWSRAKFEQITGITIPATLVVANVETDRALYIKVDRTGDGLPNATTRVETPADDPFLSTLAGVKTVVKRAAEYQWLKGTAEFPLDDYIDDGEKWVLVEAPDRVSMRARGWMAKNNSDIVAALSFLWEIAQRKNLFDGESVPQSVTNTMDDLIAHRDKFINNA